MPLFAYIYFRKTAELTHRNQSISECHINKRTDRYNNQKLIQKKKKKKNLLIKIKKKKKKKNQEKNTITFFSRPFPEINFFTFFQNIHKLIPNGIKEKFSKSSKFIILPGFPKISTLL